MKAALETNGIEALKQERSFSHVTSASNKATAQLVKKGDAL
jgi:hypothetical protein